MRKAITIIAVLAIFALPGEAFAMGNGNGRANGQGKPEPITCPDDVDAALAAECPCDGTVQPDESVEPWRNHGQYVRCVVRYRNQLRKAGCVTKEERRTIKRCAARSTCGKADRVLCCISTMGTCDDVVPNDIPEGVCSNDPDVACDTDADCTDSRTRITRGEAACMDAGGVVSGTGSVCEPCAPPEVPAQ